MYTVKFLSNHSLLKKYTMGECKVLAQYISKKFNGIIIGIGSDNFDGYKKISFDDNTFSLEEYNNPMHYLTKIDNQYIDITGVFTSKKHMIEYYNNFYKYGLKNISSEIDIKIWPRSSDIDSCEEINIESCIKNNIDIIDNNIYKVKFILLSVSNCEKLFAKAFEIVFNSTTYIYNEKYYSIVADNIIVTINGILNEFHHREKLQRKIFTNYDNIDEYIELVSSIDYELIYGEDSFTNEWYFTPAFPYDSFGYSILHIEIQNKMKHPFIGYLLMLDLDKKVKDYILSDDIYSAVSEYFDWEINLYPKYKNQSYIKYSSYNMIFKFLNLNIQKDDKHYQLHKLLPYKLKFDNDKKYISQQVKKLHHIPQYQDDYKLFISKIVWYKLSQMYDFIPDMIFVRENAHIYFDAKKEVYTVDDNNLTFEIFINIYINFIKTILEINKSITFFYGLKSISNVYIDKNINIVLNSFDNSIYIDSETELKNNGIDYIFSFFYDKLNIPIEEQYLTDNLIDIDQIIFCHLSSNFYKNDKIRRFCHNEMSKLLNHINIII